MKVRVRAKAKSRVTTFGNRVAVAEHNQNIWFAVPVGDGWYKVSTAHWGRPQLSPAEKLSGIFGEKYRVGWVLEGIKAVQALIPL